MKKLAYLAGNRLDLTEIWYRGVFLDLKSKTVEILYDAILTSK